jgi:alpha-galactosidase/6-phospho-beta-glucosidase family protein
MSKKFSNIDVNTSDESAADDDTIQEEEVIIDEIESDRRSKKSNDKDTNDDSEDNDESDGTSDSRSNDTEQISTFAFFLYNDESEQTIMNVTESIDGKMTDMSEKLDTLVDQITTMNVNMKKMLDLNEKLVSLALMKQ